MKSTEHAKILIVEDEGIIADNLAFRLSTAGYDVTGIAESARDAMEKIRERVPELILMDIRIKGSVDGIDATAALREHSDIPVIYLTAYSDQKTIDRAKVTGASGFLAKPIQYSALGNAIEMAISKHRSDGNPRLTAEAVRSVLDSIERQFSTDTTTTGGDAAKGGPSGASSTPTNRSG
jgi:DNA-binding NtrC family response regulator